jgi:DNA modification methylase
MNQILKKSYKELLPEIESNSIDLIAIDPPYEIGYQGLGWDKKNSIDWEFLFNHCYRILKDTGNFIMFTGWSNTKHVLEEKDKAFKKGIDFILK